MISLLYIVLNLIITICRKRYDVNIIIFLNIEKMAKGYQNSALLISKTKANTLMCTLIPAKDEKTAFRGGNSCFLFIIPRNKHD